MQLAIMLAVWGLAMAFCGSVYQRHPNIFRRGIWLKTSIAIRTMTPEAYVLYIKRIGRLYVGIGFMALVAGVLWTLLIFLRR